MSSTAEQQQPAGVAGLGRLTEFDPRELELDPRNVRTERVKPDPGLLASVEVIGVQEPISVRPLGEGRYGVVKGQRRWLAAIAAAEKAAKKGQPIRMIPAFVRDDLTEADAEAVLLSLVENTQREGMTARDTVAAAAQLELISNNETDRRRAAKVLGIKRDALKAATKAADMSPEVLQKGAGYGFDLAELADLAEVEELSNAASTLASAKRRDREEGKNRRGHWQHAMAQLREELAEERKRAAAERPLTDAGVKVLPRYRAYGSTERPLSELTTGAGKKITPHDHGKHCAGHAARLDDDCKPVYYCTDPGKFGHRAKGEPDAAQVRQMKEAERAKRRRVIANNKAWKAAREVRKDFVTELCARKTISEASWQLVLSTVLNTPYLYSRWVGKHATADVARFARVADPESTAAAPFAGLIQRTGKARRPHLLLAHVAAAYEAEMHDQAWRSPDATLREWLTFLVNEGYTLSDIEAETLAEAEKRAAGATAYQADEDEQEPGEDPEQETQPKPSTDGDPQAEGGPEGSAEPDAAAPGGQAAKSEAESGPQPRDGGEPQAEEARTEPEGAAQGAEGEPQAEQAADAESGPEAGAQQE